MTFDPEVAHEQVREHLAARRELPQERFRPGSLLVEIVEPNPEIRVTLTMRRDEWAALQRLLESAPGHTAIERKLQEISPDPTRDPVERAHTNGVVDFVVGAAGVAARAR